jgi:hypothetical protein
MVVAGIIVLIGAIYLKKRKPPTTLLSLEDTDASRVTDKKQTTRICIILL